MYIRHTLWLRSTIAAPFLALALAGGARAQDDDSDEGDPSGAVVQSDDATRAQLVKAAAARKAVEEGLEANREQQRLNNKAQELKANLLEPNGLCQTMDTQDGMVTGKALAQGNIWKGQRATLKTLSSNTSTGALLDSSFAWSNAHFCSVDEIASNICAAPTDTAYTNLAGADQDAMFLFQAKDGEGTYEGTRDGAQVEAVNGYIARVVVGVPPEQLRAGTVKYGNSPQARAYYESLRRYQAFLSMSTYSLNQIKESRNPLK
jgi:hypothetical protein